MRKSLLLGALTESTKEATFQVKKSRAPQFNLNLRNRRIKHLKVPLLRNLRKSKRKKRQTLVRSSPKSKAGGISAMLELIKSISRSIHPKTTVTPRLKTSKT